MLGDITTMKGCTDIQMVLRKFVIIKTIMMVSSEILINKVEKWAGFCLGQGPNITILLFQYKYYYFQQAV